MLNNSIIQMGFIDTSNIILLNKQKQFIFISKLGKQITYQLPANINMIQDQHALKRLKYTINLVNSLVEKH